MVSFQSPRQAIRQLVFGSPQLSQRAILNQLRSQGFRISNRAGRQIVNESRLEIARGAQRLSDLVNETVARQLRDNKFVDFTLREIELEGKSEEVIERILRNNIREREVFINDRRGRGVRVSDFTHVVVNYTASALFTTFIQGRVFDETSETISGTFTTEVTAFTEELLSERVRQTAIGQFTQRLGQRQGLGNNSVIAGLTVEMSNLTIAIDSLMPRGRRGLIPNEGGRGLHFIAQI